MYESDIKPFHMFGNLYFVGAKKVSVHLLDTEEGLVLIDTGYPHMYEQILHSIRSLGFDPKNICAILHSHGHVDHFGCTSKIKEISGCKTFISRIDNDIVNGKLDLSWAKELNMDPLPYFDGDVLVDDGDVFRFGSTEIRCVLTPGHTDGVLSFFVKLREGNETVTAAMHGGVGLNTLKKKWLEDNGFSLKNREVYRQSLYKVMEEKVDFAMGNHPGQTKTQAKQEKLSRGESILDPTEWKNFLLGMEEKLDELIKSGE